MNIKFEIQDDNTILTKIIEDDSVEEFNYVQFIDKLYDGVKFEGYTIDGTVNENIQASLDSMVTEINLAVQNQLQEEQEIDHEVE
jgi:hypothetical protein